MKQNTLIALGAAAVIAAGAAFWAGTREIGTPNQDPLIGQLFFPQLTQQAATVTRVVVRRADATMTYNRGDNGWTIAERANYPVDFARLRELLYDLSQMRHLEPRTSNRDLLANMDVGDPTGESRSAQVELMNAQGQVLAALVVGRTRPASGPESATAFVRRAGQPQAWLARGQISLPRDPPQWLSREVLLVDRTRIRAMTVTQPDGAQVTVERPNRDTEDFTLLDVPEGRTAKPAVDLNQFGTTLDRLDLEDVARADTIDFANPYRASMRTFDGLEVTSEMVERDGNTWVRFMARAIPVTPTAPPATPATPPAGDQPPTQAATPPTPATPATPATPPAASPAAPAPAAGTPNPEDEVRMLNARFAGWAYRLPAFRVEGLKRTLEDLLEARPS